DNNKHHMWMWFHTTLDDTVLFDFWLIDAPWKMALSCASIFLLGVTLEAIRFLRFQLSTNSSASFSCRTNYGLCALSEAHPLQTLLFTVEVVLGYLLMLVFMTFSVWLCLAVILGTAFGYYIFGYRPPYSSVSVKRSIYQAVKE
uniref:Copper transport protein n=2 Tax=Parascaris TaxID=6254 RepID=A0A915B120_PARUN